HLRSIGGNLRRTLLDMMSELLEQRGGIANALRDFGVERPIRVSVLVGECDAQAPGLPPDLVGVRALRRRRVIDAGQLGAAECIHHHGAVAYADADHVVAGEAAPAFAAVWTERHAGAGRLHAEHAASSGWNTNRTTAIAGMRERQH